MGGHDWPCYRLGSRDRYGYDPRTGGWSLPTRGGSPRGDPFLPARYRPAYWHQRGMDRGDDHQELGG